MVKTKAVTKYLVQGKEVSQNQSSFIAFQKGTLSVRWLLLEFPV